mmetsp:Transcript_4878/g.6599  ORF Transcript_4878/g.6599 Transcript_4878/m.6599 type:complete len:295 (+) Transcript_4878:167-1051(+)|eukprot:CAMPEP_0116066946 /NCGR_PEP_ID=MMETSP0322-20121206/10706_1 /TAXON_ID=163516 /ORGANISM="Leptocylindrus danicus var. apora, Strain B651" /LENGTH=294 /DNA_ID=CAMNT_0003553639 /DNA_START=133 /DNA_END=1017 /DNA_ORIENTATION=+
MPIDSATQRVMPLSSSSSSSYQRCWASSLLLLSIISTCSNAFVESFSTSPTSKIFLSSPPTHRHGTYYVGSLKTRPLTIMNDKVPIMNDKISTALDIEDDNDEECEIDDDLCLAEEKKNQKIQLRVDGLEPYVLVSAITATSSFGVLTPGNFFDEGLFDGSIKGLFKFFLLASTLASSALGLYALGIFSFCILYSKAALARDDDDSTDVYETFFGITAKLRYRGFLTFLRSLELFVLNLFLFAISHLPDEIVPYAVVISAISIYYILKDWNEIIDAAGVIYLPSQTKTSNDEKK